MEEVLMDLNTAEKEVVNTTEYEEIESSPVVDINTISEAYNSEVDSITNEYRSKIWNLEMELEHKLLILEAEYKEQLDGINADV